jgi:FkbM family methyltransferase
MKIYYGITNHSIDVTDICLEKLTNNNTITIPCGDSNRAAYFTDPLPGILKKVIVALNDNLTEYDEITIIKINIINNTITTINEFDIDNKMKSIHSKLNIKYGSFDEELPEQKMAVRYLKGDEKVLEIGGNIGRNSLIIASILENDANLVTLECDINIANQLKENRDLNNFKFNIEVSALSNRKLIQIGWDTKPSDILEEGYNFVNTISLSELKNKYNMEFDTLVLDCEGAFYYILIDMPEILNNIKLIIMENDYWDITKKNYIDDILKQHNFYVDYAECGGWGPCYNNFFEVWKKLI